MCGLRDLCTHTRLFFYSERKRYGHLSGLRSICQGFSGISGNEEADIFDTDTIIGNGFPMIEIILFPYIAMHCRIFLVSFAAYDRSAETVFHRVIFFSSADCENHIPASCIVVFFRWDGIIIIIEIDSFFPDIACYLFGDVPDIFLDDPHDFQPFIDLDQVAVDHEYGEHYDGEYRNGDDEFYEREGGAIFWSGWSDARKKRFFHIL